MPCDGAGHGFFNVDSYFEPTQTEMLSFLASLGWVGGAIGRSEGLGEIAAAVGSQP